MKIDQRFCKSVKCRHGTLLAGRYVCQFLCEHYHQDECEYEPCGTCRFVDELPRQCPYRLEMLVRK